MEGCDKLREVIPAVIPSTLLDTLKGVFMVTLDSLRLVVMIKYHKYEQDLLRYPRTHWNLLSSPGCSWISDHPASCFPSDGLQARLLSQLVMLALQMIAVETNYL